ncbi:hypothetical protein [Mycoplasmopsis arginini]|uniref:hypothetical protein n=1 Tax=Mycoplasmopsis arginini TaxID=2094 RepID=UPI0002D1C0B7|nr:hypothetical protein [Mycoplasmopsis arginini]SGA03246.1 Uncharacterised protein [Chlamydia abortus]ENY69939.1 Hypothetical protein MARG_0920 [Mycoplasmopsis arginini 7264]MDI3348158.1 hypothetical protein [Mycoplasmopsis arginini]PWC09181.1 hypothetical protein DIE66_00195 [Mycoplasmopsis arginini]SGA28404.1 Uncharacterised protein [Mycoplasmopsis arginini]
MEKETNKLKKIITEDTKQIKDLIKLIKKYNLNVDLDIESYIQDLENKSIEEIELNKIIKNLNIDKNYKNYEDLKIEENQELLDLITKD